MMPRRSPVSPVLLSALAALCMLTGCRSGAFPQYAANYREYAYVANSGSGSVSVLDVVNLRAQTTLQVGPAPSALLAAKLRNRVYVASGGAAHPGRLTIIDAETNTIASTLPLGRQPAALALDPAETHLYAANRSSNTISVMDLARGVKQGTVGTGEQPTDLAVSPDGSTLVVANHGVGSVSLMTLSPGQLPQLRASFNGCPGAGSTVILPDSSKAFTACSGGRQVMVVGLRTPPGKKLAPTEQRAQDALLTMLDVGANPVHLTMKPDGGELFAENAGANTVSEIETGTNEVANTYLIGASPAWALVSADNAMLWVANSGSDTVAVYSIDDGRLVNTIEVGSGPGAMAFSADGNLLLAADTRSGDVSVLHTFTRNQHREPVYGALFTLLPAGDAPVAIVDKAFRLRR